MKYILLVLLLLPFDLFAQVKPDAAYELQRNKVNSLLAQRSANFGQYDQSLNSRTGIFGFQTKRDIKNSNEILRQIALNDNEIFKELKILMDYKDVQSQQIEASANNNASRIELYRSTIKKLQDKNIELTDLKEQYDNKVSNRNYLILLLFAALFITGYLFIKRNRIPTETRG